MANAPLSFGAIASRPIGSFGLRSIGVAAIGGAGDSTKRAKRKARAAALAHFARQARQWRDVAPLPQQGPREYVHFAELAFVPVKPKRTLPFEYVHIAGIHFIDMDERDQERRFEECLVVCDFDVADALVMMG